jgi:hypothetical protein
MLQLFSYFSLLVSSTSFVSSSFSLLFLVTFVVSFCFLFLYPCLSFYCTFYNSFPILIYTAFRTPHYWSLLPHSSLLHLVSFPRYICCMFSFLISIPTSFLLLYCTLYFSLTVPIRSPVSNSPLTFSTASISCELPSTFYISGVSARPSAHFFMYIYCFVSSRCVKSNNTKRNFIANTTIYWRWYYY